MGRNQARKTLDLEQEIRKLDELGVVHTVRSVKDLDEAPSAYKDIDVVMENQKDLVEIAYILQPLAVIKG
jgi:tRNA-splicing ligase RtcB